MNIIKMSENRYKFYRSGLMLTAVALAMRSVAMLFGAFVTRAVGAEGIGLYTVISTVYSFAVTLATSGISLTVTRLVASAIGEGREESVGSVLRGAIIYSLAFGALASLLLFFGAELIGGNILSDKRSVMPLKVLSLALIPTSLCSALSGYFIGVRRVGQSAAAQVLSQAVKIIVTVILINKMSGLGVGGAVLGLCLGVTVTEVVSFLFIYAEFLIDRKIHAVRGGSDRSRLGEVTRVAIPLALSAYVRSVLLTVEHILIPKRLRDGGESSEEAYSHYGTLHGMAIPIVIYPMSPLSSFSGLLVPEFAADLAAGNRERMSRIASEAMNMTLLYASVSAVLLYSFSEELGYALYGSYDAGYYVAILAFVVPIMYLDHVTDAVLKGIGEQVYSMWVNISDSLLSVFLVWLLIPRMGILGYAVVIVAMEGYNFLLSIIRLSQKVHFKITPISSVVLPLILTYLSAALAERLFRFGGSGVSTLWLFLKMLFALSILVAAYGLISALKARGRKTKAAT
ncbi:MAG: oligosaccharide flippase family protein [Clostridia bacterium]|nr:oligosaccharide flippase family protein [Clostridia bacterium]